MNTGIAGIIYPDILQVSDLVEPMLDTLRHRGGPTFETHTYKNIQIGIHGGPIGYNEKKTRWAAIDGVIENMQELIKEMRSQGRKVQVSTTADFLVQAYEHWDMEFLDKISGDFAIVLCDQLRGSIILARDRVGKKPLYWYQDNHYFIFASEIKAILATGVVPQTPAEDAIAAYLFFGYLPQDLTPIKDISKVLPCHYLHLKLNGGKTILPYWSYSAQFENRTSAHKNKIVNQLDQLLDESVRIRIGEDPNLGCIVSGGLGSATIANYVRKAMPDKSFPAFSVGFKGQNDLDILSASEVAKDLKIPHLVDWVTPNNMLDNLVSTAWYLDEPIGDPNVVATAKLADLAHKDVRAVFSGMGCDELLAGHSRYTVEEEGTHYLSRMMLVPTPLIRHFVAPLMNMIFRPAAFNILRVLKTNPLQFEYLRHNALFDEKNLSEVSPKLAGIFDPDSFLHKFHHLSRIKSIVSSYLYFDIKTRLPDCFMLQYERLMTSRGLHWQTPFLDRSIIEFAATLPEPESLNESETATYLKPLLKHVFSDLVVSRPKKTRREFLTSWTNAPTLRKAFELLEKGTLVETGIISRHWIRMQLLPDNFNHEAFRDLWAILMLEVWFRLFINRPIQSEAPKISLLELLSES